jgi:hypothetical protein
MPDNAVLTARIRSLEANQKRAFVFGVELKLQLVHPLLQLRDFLERGFFLFMFRYELRVEIFQANFLSRFHSELLPVIHAF